MANLKSISLMFSLTWYGETLLPVSLKMVHFCLGHFQLLFPLILIFKIVTWSKNTNLSVVCSNLTRDLFENENLSFIENKIFNKHCAKVQLSGVFK